MPNNRKPKARAKETSTVTIHVGNSLDELTIEQRKKQAQEPIYLDRY
ncbi:MAG TPA: hypothetical protein VMD05_09645 [Candidatus Nanoarchaeia archaeon]|nr:hypothetical protein [Candidatus Nanoarchaeia archaeon]